MTVIQLQSKTPMTRSLWDLLSKQSKVLQTHWAEVHKQIDNLMSQMCVQDQAKFRIGRKLILRAKLKLIPGGMSEV